MTTNFALSLSFEGIELLHRVTRGWKQVGTAAIDDVDLVDKLAGLRTKALEIAPIGLTTKLIIPMDQIKYVAIDSTRTNLDDIHAALDGATPYDLNELVIDYERSGGRTHIAAVARETLQEAEAFASAHRFNPVAFVAVPEPFTFQKEVFFGATSEAAQILGPDVSVERDRLPVMKVGTRVKSRLLIMDTLPDGIAEAETALDLPTQTVRQADSERALTEVETVDTPAEPDPATVWIDRILPEYAAPDAPAAPPASAVPSAPPVSTPVEPSETILWVDRIVPEYQPPRATEVVVDDAPPKEATVVAARPVIAQSPVYADISGMNLIIAEYHPATKASAKPVLTAIAPTISAPAAAASLTATKPQSTPQPHTRKKAPAVVLGLAASVAAAAVFAWSQSGGTAPDAPITPQTLTITTEATVEEAPSAIEPVTTTEVGPVVPVVNILRMAPPATGPASVVIPAADTAPTIPDAPAIIVAASTGLPPQLDTASAQQETPRAPLAAAEPRGQVLSPAEAQAAYEATGVWQRAPRLFDTPRVPQDVAVTLPAFITAGARAPQPEGLDDDGMAPELSFLAPANPPAADVVFNIDENGRIVPTTEGTVTPEGAIVYAGLPDLTLRERPELTEEQLARMAVLSDVPEGVVVILGSPDIVPPTRPDDIATQPEEADDSTATAGAVGLDGLQSEPTNFATFAPPEGTARPRTRPDGLVPPAPIADPSTPDITAILEGIIAEDGSQPFIEMTPQAVGTSLRPTARPRNFATVVAAARERQAAQPAPAAAPAAAATVAPQNYAPVPGGVAVAATQEDAIRLRDLNLIGIYGRPNAPRALVRLGNGRYVHVEVGSDLDGGQVTAIGDGVLNYVKRGRTVVLEVPGS
ncbi:hypothetical protein DS901_13310 [Loktanella sp. D2R18]|uniref:hypothetical protein n=1 Tax=Rhodobacterales TaxID=204455 RepID=UPI000DEB4775|nr:MULTISPECIES: hypothetical protein [Rhodobacterales]MDO6591719.1 hypothetical protein [Yoonia sp. 1_MG-2023]RBW42541.1 hypothetical protein DS901_13310 [Loktanella sp. D2R18]